jgi:hypothetical protein
MQSVWNSGNEVRWPLGSVPNEAIHSQFGALDSGVFQSLHDHGRIDPCGAADEQAASTRELAALETTTGC